MIIIIYALGIFIILKTIFYKCNENFVANIIKDNNFSKKFDIINNAHKDIEKYI